MKYGIIFSVILLVHGNLWAQDPHFTQFYANPMYTNPALTGTGFRDGIAAGRVSSNYRSQWAGLPGGYRTHCLGWDQPLDVLHGALGAQIIGDVQASGMVTKSEINVYYAYAYQNKKETLQFRVGGRLSYIFSSFDPIFKGNGVYLDPLLGIYDITGSHPIGNIQYPNSGIGAHLNGKKWNAGIQIANAIEPNNSFYGNPDQVLKKRLVLHGGYAFIINSQWQITPQMQLMKQGYAKEGLIGTQVNRKEFFTGVWFRQMFGHYQNADAIAFNLGYGIKGLKLMYSYDQNISDGRSAFYSSHEVSLRFCWKTKQKGMFGMRSVY